MKIAKNVVFGIIMSGWMLAVLGCGTSRPAELPSGDQLVSLTEDSLDQVGRAINTQDFSEFHAYISRPWADKTTPDDFAAMFKPMIDSGVDILPVLKKTSPIFEQAPSIMDNGRLSVKGYYPTKPSRFFFNLEYVHEGNVWKLARTNVGFKRIQE